MTRSALATPRTRPIAVVDGDPRTGAAGVSHAHGRTVQGAGRVG